MTPIPDYAGEGKDTPRVVLAWMWFEGFGPLPGSPWNSTTDGEVAKAMSKLGFDLIALVPATQRDERIYRKASADLLTHTAKEQT